jgi:hypothetical protein
VAALPGIHARGALGRLLPPVMGSLLEHSVDGAVRRRVYVSGDTLEGAHLDAVRDRFPHIDVAVVHLGGPRVLAHAVTMDAAQGVGFLRRIGPTAAVPVTTTTTGCSGPRCRTSWPRRAPRGWSPTCEPWDATP